MKHSEIKAVNVNLTASTNGADQVVLTLCDGCDVQLALTPAQARLLATELITAVNRAEVKGTLKTSPNLWRRTGASRPRLATLG